MPHPVRKKYPPIPLYLCSIEIAQIGDRPGGAGPRLLTRFAYRIIAARHPSPLLRRHVRREHQTPDLGRINTVIYEGCCLRRLRQHTAGRSTPTRGAVGTILCEKSSPTLDDRQGPTPATAAGSRVTSSGSPGNPARDRRRGGRGAPGSGRIRCHERAHRRVPWSAWRRSNNGPQPGERAGHPPGEVPDRNHGVGGQLVAGVGPTAPKLIGQELGAGGVGEVQRVADMAGPGSGTV